MDPGSFLFTGRRPAVLIAIGVVVVVVLVIVLGGRRSSGSALDAGLRRTGDRVAAVLDHPKPTLPIPDPSFRSFQAWYYDLRAAFTRASAAVAGPQTLEGQVYDKDAFPPQFFQFPAPNGVFVILDASTVNAVVRDQQPAFTTVSVAGKPYRAYVAPLTVPANLKPATVGGYFAVLQPGS